MKTKNINKILNVALALGQKAEIIDSIKNHQTHLAMAAFGLWQSEGFEKLTSNIYSNRKSKIKNRKSKWASSQV